MKKITFWLTIVLLFLVVKNQAQTEDFETTNSGDIPTGWVKYQSESDDPGFVVDDQSGYAYSGSKYLVHLGEDIATESTSWVVSSSFVPSNYYELKFFWRGKWSSVYNFTGVYISTGSNDPITNPGDFTLLEELSPTNYPNTWLQWNQANYDLSPYVGQTIYLAFKYVGDFAHDFYIDNISIAPMPYCQFPEITNTIRDLNTIDVSWSAVTDALEYEIVWGAPGFDPNASGVSSATTTDTNYQITGLTESTSYDIYVRAYCSSYNVSDWSQVETVMTMGPPPANDLCSDAIPLTVYPTGGGAGNELAQSTDNASDSTIHPSCDNFGTNLDLWYTVTVPAGENGFKIITSGPQGDNIEAAVYDSCGGMEIACEGNSNTKLIGGLTGGQTYYLQLWLDDFNSGSFNVVIESLPPHPCTNAMPLTVYPVGGGAGNELAQSTISETDSGYHPSCDNSGTNLDIWYEVTVPAGENGFRIITSGPQGDNIEAAVYDACPGFEIACFGNSSSKVVSGLTGGQTYYVQVWLDDFNSGDFNIVIESIPSAPGNDLCSGATPLTVYPAGGGAGNELAQNTVAATDSNMHPSCDNFGTNLDLWYTVTVPAGENGFRIITSGPQGDNIEAAIYDSCGGTEIACFGNSSSKVVSGLTGGQTYYVQVWLDDFNSGDFNIVIESIPSAPGNDLCSGAIPLTVYPAGGGAGNELAQSTVAATDSNVHPSCDNTGVNLDLWYTVTVPAGESGFQIITSGAAGSSIEAAIYDNCGGIEIACFGNSSSKVVSGLTGGQTYYVQVWLDDFNSGDFNIVIESIPSAPGNDTCSGALDVTPSNTCTPVFETNLSATDSGIGDPGCANYSGGDLWFKTTIPASGNLTIETVQGNNSSVTDTGLAVYDGSCSGLTIIDCDDDDGPGLFSQIVLTGRTPGETIYIRVWEYGNNSFGEIGVCAYDTSVSLVENTIEGLRYFPNPVTNLLNISALNTIEEVKVFDLSGKEYISLHPDRVKTQIDLQHLQSGIYFVKVAAKGETTIFKVVKK